MFSGVRLSRLYLPGMKGRGWGRIVNSSAARARSTPPAGMIHYGMSKTVQLAAPSPVGGLVCRNGVSLSNAGGLTYKIARGR